MHIAYAQILMYILIDSYAYFICIVISQTTYTHWPNIGKPLAILALVFSWEAILGQYWFLIGNYWHWRYIGNDIGSILVFHWQLGIGKILARNIGLILVFHWHYQHWPCIGKIYWINIGFPLATWHWCNLGEKYWVNIGFPLASYHWHYIGKRYIGSMLVFHWHWRNIGEKYWVNVGFPLASQHWHYIGKIYWINIGFHWQIGLPEGVGYNRT